jgi:hypothetical protein
MAFIADWNKYNRIGSWLSDLEVHDDYNIVIMWDDDYRYCTDCSKYLSSNDYGLWVSDYDYLCEDCARDCIEDVIEYYKNDYTKAIPDFLINSIKEQGFICMDDQNSEACQIFENGLYTGVNDNPYDIVEDMKKESITDKYDYIFGIYDSNPFCISFCVYLRGQD